MKKAPEHRNHLKNEHHNEAHQPKRITQKHVISNSKTCQRTHASVEQLRKQRNDELHMSTTERHTPQEETQKKHCYKNDKPSIDEQRQQKTNSTRRRMEPSPNGRRKKSHYNFIQRSRPGNMLEDFAARMRCVQSFMRHHEHVWSHCAIMINFRRMLNLHLTSTQHERFTQRCVAFIRNP